METIADTVYHLPEIVGGPTILVGDGLVVVVDTGVPGSETAILAAVAEIGRTADDVTDIVITHADGDHVGGLEALVEATGATVWAPTREADVIEGLAPGRRGDAQRRGSVDVRFEPGETLPLHGGIETHDTHGHTQGHVSLFLRDSRILIAGDALNNRDGSGVSGSAPEHTADAADARAAVTALAALEPDTIVFGHGPSIVGDAAAELTALDASIDG
jgi:glyoxylase-like metal-dependent hydrolase (beta-lactamase superfamily II)